MKKMKKKGINSNESNKYPVERMAKQQIESENKINEVKLSSVIVIDSSSDNQFLKNFENSKDEEEEDQVCMVDLTEAEWWTIVDSARDRETQRSEADTYVECELATESTTDDDESYLLVEEKQLGDALSNFVAQAILKKYPEAKTLSEKQLNSLIDSSFNGLKEPTTVGRYVKYGQMAYTTYGWGMCAWSLYKDPKMIKLAATCAFKAARWVFILLW